VSIDPSKKAPTEIPVVRQKNRMEINTSSCQDLCLADHYSRKLFHQVLNLESPGNGGSTLSELNSSLSAEYCKQFRQLHVNVVDYPQKLSSAIPGSR